MAACTWAERLAFIANSGALGRLRTFGAVKLNQSFWGGVQ
jgi:hypothetical protein